MALGSFTLHLEKKAQLAGPRCGRRVPDCSTQLAIVPDDPWLWLLALRRQPVIVQIGNFQIADRRSIRVRNSGYGNVALDLLLVLKLELEGV